jgi:hypothetical protein
VSVAAGSKTADFSVTTSTVTTTKVVSVTATYQNTSKSAQLTISPAADVSVASVSVNPVSVTTEATAMGTVTLSGPAPAGGTVVYLWTNGYPAYVPTSVTVAAGATSGTFVITTDYVSSAQQGTITAFYKGLSKTATITVTPVASLLSVSATAQAVGGGVNTIGQVTLSAPAPASGTVVYLWTNGSPVFVPVSVTVSAGTTAATFTISTNWVAAATQGTITAFYNGMIKTTTLTVMP